MPPLVFLLFLCFLAPSTLAHLHDHDHSDSPPVASRHPSRIKFFETVNSATQVKKIYKTLTKTLIERDGVNQPYPDHMRLKLDAYGVTFVFDLEINELLLHPDITIKVFGKTEDDFRTLAPTHRYYKGNVTSSFGSGWARLSLLGMASDNLVLNGAFVQDGEVFEVKPTDHFEMMNVELDGAHRKRLDQGDVHMVVYRHSDIEILDPEAEKCGVEDAKFNALVSDGQPFSPSSGAHDYTLDKRALSGCPTAAKVLYMGVASECTYTTKFSGASGTTDQILANWNKVSALYESTFNVALGLIELHIMETCGSTPPDPKGGVLTWNQDCSTGYTISNRLSDFAHWRGQQTPDAGLWHLMSTCPTGSTIGIAWLNMLCQTASFDQSGSSGTEYVSGVGVSTSVSNEWIVISHEIGHNFGAKHDCTSSCQPGDTTCCNCSPGCDCKAQFIMHPSNSIATNTFSECSQTTICSRSAITGTCLSTPGSRSVLNVNVCGNGILEPPNEECDCGGSDACANDTCCYSNCTLKAGATCSDANSACCLNCQVNPSNTTVCRVVEGECDVAEVCDGQSFVCPTDRFKEDGSPCTEIADAYCATGKCTNRAQQCKNVALLYEKPEFTEDCLGSCQLFCQSSLEGCRYFPGNFLNGTKCGKDGYCQGGICSTGDPIGGILAFIKKNLILVIVGASVLGLLILGFLFWGCRKANRKDIKLGKSLSKLTIRRKPNGNGNANANANANAQPPARASQGQANPQRGSVASQSRNAPSRSSDQAQAQARNSPNRQSQSQAGGDARRLSNNPQQPNPQRNSQVRSSMVGAPAPPSPGSIPENPPDYNEIALQVRCPVCQKMFASETDVDRHLDAEH